MAGEALRDRAQKKANGEASTDVATKEQQDQGPQSIAQYLELLAPQLERALPGARPGDGDRIARIALTLIRKTPKLAECSPASFAASLMTASQLGLDLGVEGEAYLVPYKRECTLIVGYRGYTKLFWQHPMARHIDAQAVYENDDFDYAYGLNPFLRHKPARENRGKVIYFYAVASLSTGASTFVVLTPDEVKTLRNGKVGPSGDIPDPQLWMERKTAIRQMVKTLPKSPALAQAVESDERTGSELKERMEITQLVAPTEETSQAVPAGVDPATGEYDPTMADDYQPEQQA